MNWMLQRVVTGGTGIAAKLDDRQVAGKTGTSENTRDLWFIGSIPQLTTGVWFGYDDDRATKSTSGEAAWAWKQFMLQIKDEILVRNFPEKPKLNRKVRLAVDPKTIAKPPMTKPKQKKENGNGEPDAAQPSVESDQPGLTPVEPPLRQTPYLWRDSSPSRSVDRQGRRWNRD
jgi:penicillin-binding protein 1A